MRDILEALLTRADIGVAVLAPDLKVERACAGLDRLLDRDAESLVGLSLLELMPVADRQRILDLLPVAGDATLGTARTIVHIVRPDGAELVLKAALTTMEQAEGARTVLLLSDITSEEEAIGQERRQTANVLRAYSDLVSAITGGRLLIVSEDDLNDQLGEVVFGPVDFDDEIGPSSIRYAAREAVESLDDVVWDDGFELGFGELLVNALTHAGGGTASLHTCGDVLQAVVRDDGQGLDFAAITSAAVDSPEGALPVLGVGFTLMLSFADRMLLSTGPAGSVLVLEKASPALS